jgi:hypothetical protein
MKATVTAYYNRDPQQLVVDKPEGEWMAFDAFLRSLGFRPHRQGGRIIPGRFEFRTGCREEMGKVFGIVKSGGEYLTGGNLDSTFQI